VPAHDGLIAIRAKSDLHDVGTAGLPVSSLTGEGVAELGRELVSRARSLLPKGDDLALDRREHELLAEAHEALERGLGVQDPVLVAEELRTARLAVDRISGRAGVEELLDALFGRFCLGK
jgi:tRNA modification GTPase